MVLLFRTAAGVLLKVSPRVSIEAIVGFYSCERMWVRLLAGNSALWSVFFMEFLSWCFQAFFFPAAVFPLWCMYVVTRWWSKQGDWLQACSIDGKWRIFCGVYETAGRAKRCRAEETTQLSLSSPAVLCLFVFYCFRCAPVSYCQIYYRSFIVWRSPICMPNTQTLMLLLQAETCICLHEAAISSFLNSRPLRCTLHTCNNMRKIFLGDFMHAALLYGALGGNLKESLREVIIKAFCLTTWSKVLSMKQGSLFCFVPLRSPKSWHFMPCSWDLQKALDE